MYDLLYNHPRLPVRWLIFNKNVVYIVNRPDAQEAESLPFMRPNGTLVANTMVPTDGPNVHESAFAEEMEYPMGNNWILGGFSLLAILVVCLAVWRFCAVVTRLNPSRGGVQDALEGYAAECKSEYPKLVAAVLLRALEHPETEEGRRDLEAFLTAARIVLAWAEHEIKHCDTSEAGSDQAQLEKLHATWNVASDTVSHIEAILASLEANEVAMAVDQ